MTGRSLMMNLAAALLGALLMSVPLANSGEPAKDCAGPTCSGACAVAGDSGDRERLGEMVDRQRDELVNLTRAMAAERTRLTELESELAVARAAAKPQAAAPAPVASSNPALADENRRLQQLLDLQREENEKLAAKLRTASKVADLVFRAEEEQRPQPRREEAAAPLVHIAPAAPSNGEVPPGWTLADLQH